MSRVTLLPPDRTTEARAPARDGRVGRTPSPPVAAVRGAEPTPPRVDPRQAFVDGLAAGLRGLSEEEVGRLIARLPRILDDLRRQAQRDDAPAAAPLTGESLRRIETDEERQALDTALAAARQRGAVLAGEILRQPDMLTADAMAARLGTTRDTVNRHRRQGRLLALAGATRGYRYPAWQLDAQGRPLAGLDRVLAAAGDPWIAHRWLTRRHPALEDQTGRDALSQGRVHDLVELIGHVGEDFG